MRTMVPIFLLSALVSCQSESERTAENAINACAEIGQTSRGFGGPGDRMEILKSYGMTPIQAANLEQLFELRFYFKDELEELSICDGPRSMQYIRESCECYERAQESLSCEIGYIAVINDAAQTFAETVTEDFAQCMQ